MTRRDEPAYRAAEARVLEHYGVTPQEHVVEIEALGAAVRVLEIGRGEPIVFLHGSPNTATTWVPLAAALPGRRCLLVERPGAGLSASVRRWGNHRSDVVTLLSRVMDALSVPSADFVGSSFGGLYATCMALDAPARVRRLVQMGAPAAPGLLPIPAVFRAVSMPLLPALMLAGMKPDVAASRKMWRDIGHGDAIDRGALPEVLFSWYASLLNHTDTLLHLVDEVKAIASPLGYKQAALLGEDEMRRLGAPLLYLWGDRDTFATPEAGERLCALTPGARIERFATFGHLPWVDDVSRVAARLRAFLDEARADAPTTRAVA